MNFNDIFKSSFLDTVNAIPFIDVIIALLTAFLMGLFIFFVYKKTYKGLIYSAAFGTVLIALVMITAALILTITSNIVLSLGMVGALSIVRFRTAIKDPLDIVFLFWSISEGIIIAAGLIPLAVFGSALIGLVLIVFSNRQSFDDPYLLVIHLKDEKTEKMINETLASETKKYILKSKTITENNIELNYELRLKDADSSFIQYLYKLPSVNYCVLVAYNGDYLG